MSNPNAERDERVRQIRERQVRCIRPDRDDVPQRTAEPLARALSKELRQAQIDRGYLLSLLDSQAATDPRPHGNQHYPYCARHEGGNYNAAPACTCYDYPLVAATRMRDRCVEKVKSMGAVWKGFGDQSSGYDEKYYYGKADAADDIVKELKSMARQEDQSSRR